MSFRRPPALANWLLERFGCTRRNAALAGDLLEDFRNGRSAAWYWRQSLGVIANSITRNAVGMRPYLLALGAAYAAQAAVVLTLWSRHSPSPLQGSVWTKVGMWVLGQLAWPIYTYLVDRLVVGTPLPNIKRMYCAAESGTPRSTILALAALRSFGLGLGNYWLCALILPRFSPGELIGAEMFWFAIWIFAPALAPPAPVIEAETADPEQEWHGVPEAAPALSVVLSSGKTVILEGGSVAQPVFLAADPELIAIVFGRRRNLEVLHRAIWIAACRNSRSFTLAELDALIDETVRETSIVPRAGFLQHLRLGLRGDPADFNH